MSLKGYMFPYLTKQIVITVKAPISELCQILIYFYTVRSDVLSLKDIFLPFAQ